MASIDVMPATRRRVGLDQQLDSLNADTPPDSENGSTADCAGELSTIITEEVTEEEANAIACAKC